MSWHTSGDVRDFIDRAGEFLRSNPVENTLPLTLAETLRVRGPHFFGSEDPIFGWWAAADGKVRGAFLRTPPYPLLLTAVPEGAVAELSTRLAGQSLSAISGRTADAEEFAAAWGLPTRPGRQTRLYRLAELTPPTPMPAGRARVAGPGDRALLIDWLDRFHAEIGEPRDSSEVVDDKLSYGGLTLWEVDGRPLALAGATRAEAGMVRVIAVYTPPAERRRGFGGAATVAVSRAALDAGADDVVLFTDLSNATSNALYQRLGYRPVEDRSVLEFVS